MKKQCECCKKYKKDIVEFCISGFKPSTDMIFSSPNIIRCRHNDGQVWVNGTANMCWDCVDEYLDDLGPTPRYEICSFCEKTVDKFEDLHDWDNDGNFYCLDCYICLNKEGYQLC